MKTLKSYLLFILASAMTLTTMSSAADIPYNVTGAGGYDLVSYHTSKKPLRGNGNFTATHDGVTYLFANTQNQKAFNASPGKYIPAYGGYCAFGASVGKKFVGDPEVWRIVDGKLYLNLDVGIQSDWLKDVPGRIKTANAKWPQIKNKASSEL